MLDIERLPRLPTAPDFTLRSVTPDGPSAYRSLSDWRGRRILLVFIQPSCPHSRRLLSAIAGLRPHPPSGVAAPIIITSGTEAPIRRLIAEYRIRCPILLQDDTEVSALYLTRETPAGCLIDEMGCIADATRTGAVNVLIQAGITPGPEWSWATTEYRSAGDQLARLCAERGRELPGAEADRSYPVPEGHELPLVSVIMTTRDRPGLLSIALECYRRQTYPHRELIVVDDGGAFPADADAVAAAGGHLIRVPEGTSLGAKLNRGASEARGPLCQKWDDDDWYAPRFLETMVYAYLRHNAVIRRPTIAYQRRSLWFDLERWQVQDWPIEELAGGTLLFAREDWEKHPFRPVRRSEDVWFAVDQMKADASLALVADGTSYVYVRHNGSSDRANVWAHWFDGQPVETYLRAQASERHDPAEIFPDWALSVYATLERTRNGRSEKPRLLFLTPVAPGVSGGGRAMHAAMILQALATRYDVYLMVIPVNGARAGTISGRVASLCRSWMVMDFRNTTSEEKKREAAACFGDVRFDVVHSFCLSTADYAAPYLVPAAPDACRPAWHLDLDAIESEQHRRIADRCRADGETSEADKQDEEARRCAALETGVLSRCDRVHVCTPRDQRELEALYGLDHVHVLPDAVEIPLALPPRPPSEVFTFLFVGRLARYPNVDALRFFCGEVLPLLRRSERRRFRIVVVGPGVAADDERRAREPEVELVGKVKRMEPWYHMADAVLAPLRTGGGARLGVLEAMSFRRPVVSTPLGVEGLDVVDGEHLLIGDTPRAFAKQCRRLMSDPRLATGLTERAFNLCTQQHSLEALSAALYDRQVRLSHA
jgi:glycosyltransferase involved in cell wall biosynthesis